MRYVPLHVHTEYSLLDGAIRNKQYIKFAKENNFEAVAITDHGVMYGAVEFYKTAKKPGKAFVKGCIVFWILYLVLETPIWLKNLLPTDFFIRLDSIQKSDLSIQFSVLVFGIVFYVITCFATFKVSSKRFEKVDL